MALRDPVSLPRPPAKRWRYDRAIMRLIAISLTKECDLARHARPAGLAKGDQDPELFVSRPLEVRLFPLSDKA